MTGYNHLYRVRPALIPLTLLFRVEVLVETFDERVKAWGWLTFVQPIM